MRVAIIDYGSGNLHSAQKAFERAAREAGLTTSITLTSDPDLIRKADRIVLPGVGAFADCHAGLTAIDGLIDVMTESVVAKGTPFLGICVGMQLLASRGLEHVTTAGLDWIKGDVQRIEPQDPALKIPHMGWNTLDIRHDHALLAGIPTGANGLHAYFVHSYHFSVKNSDALVAETNYGGPITAIVAQDNIAGSQFHPEKSQRLGLAFIANFLRWRP